MSFKLHRMGGGADKFPWTKHISSPQQDSHKLYDYHAPFFPLEIAYDGFDSSNTFFDFLKKHRENILLVILLKIPEKSNGRIIAK